MQVESCGSGNNSACICFFLLHLSCPTLSSCKVGLMPPFTFTGEGTECQLVGAVLGLQLGLGACCSGEDCWPAAKGHMLGDLDPYHINSFFGPRLQLSSAQDLCYNTLKNVMHFPREVSQCQALLPH